VWLEKAEERLKSYLENCLQPNNSHNQSMNWTLLRRLSWLDTRARFVAATPLAGSLLDMGSSDGETLRHFAELRPDLRFFATDIAGKPESYPAGCEFFRADLERDGLPWLDGSMDSITCMHLVEHLGSLSLLFDEITRLLKPGGRVYFETPHPRSLVLSSPKGRAAGTFTLNFYDDPGHVRLVSIGALAQQARRVALEVVNSGTSRNWLFVAAYPVLAFFPPSRKRYTAQAHWLGWSAYLVARRQGRRSNGPMTNEAKACGN
jgi:SAM-dependent methyltransferase